MDTVADKLREARALVAKGWTRQEYAKGHSGASVAVTGPFAVCWCAAGAIGAANHEWPNSRLPGMKELSLAVGGDGHEADVINWNDRPERTQAEVLAAFDKAILLAEQGESR